MIDDGFRCSASTRLRSCLFVERMLISRLLHSLFSSSAADTDSKSSRLVVVLVCQAWNPPSLAVAKECEKLRSAKIPVIKSPIFLIDADDDKNKTWDIKSVPQDTNRECALQFRLSSS